MTRTRLTILLLGPPLLIAGAYVLSYSGTVRAQPTAGLAAAPIGRASSTADAEDVHALDAACRVSAERLRPALPRDSAVIIRPPFVIAGDQSTAELEKLYRETIHPVTEALWRCYFDRRPDEPVVVVAASNEASYREVAARLDGYEPAAYSGYTRRGERRIVYNAATGAGTLAHELAHILASFDFPEMPEWFDEGLAALHEATALSSDGLTLTGEPNWRCRLLRKASRRGELPRLESVVRARTFRGEGEGLHYAYVRGLCLYLQERGMLTHYYRKFRANVHSDGDGLATLCGLLNLDSPAEFDRDFQAWVATQRPAGRAEEAAR